MNVAEVSKKPSGGAPHHRWKHSRLRTSANLSALRQLRLGDRPGSTNWFSVAGSAK